MRVNEPTVIRPFGEGDFKGLCKQRPDETWPASGRD